MAIETLEDYPYQISLAKLNFNQWISACDWLLSEIGRGGVEWQTAFGVIGFKKKDNYLLFCLIWL